MPRRISAEIDMQILADLGLGLLHREIAVKYGVSPSYVSKLSLGKKVPDIHITAPPKRSFTAIELNEDDLVEINDIIQSAEVFVSPDQAKEYLNQQIRLTIIRLKVYTELLNKYQGDK